MFYALLLICIGIVIGWNLPQPAWARSIQDKVVAAIRSAEQRPGGTGGPGV